MALGFIIHYQPCSINEFNSLQMISTHLLREGVVLQFVPKHMPNL
jgi:hypothetical protein